MDGNGRWAAKRGLPRLLGHKEGVTTLKNIVRACPSLGVHTLTLFAFAVANWKRSKEEVEGLWKLFEIFIEEDLQELIEQGVRVVVIGNKDGLPPSVVRSVEKAEASSKDNTKFLLQVALNYDGVDEVARLMKRAIASGVSEHDITSEYVQSHLDTIVGNDPDIIIRTGMPAPKNGMGVWRSSAFLPIQSAQSVCVSCEVLWPDFTSSYLKEAIVYADAESRLFGSQRA